MFQLRNSFSHLIKQSLRGIVLKRQAHMEHKVDIGNNVCINIVESGEGEQSVLLMPGALGSAWTDFKPQIEKLPDLLPNYKIIAWDPPGFGKSIPPQRAFGLNVFHEDARQAVELMKALKRDKFSILGWSDGGITALILAGRYPKNVDRLVIWGAGAYINAEEVKALEAIRDVNKWSPRMREPMEKVYGKQEFAELWAQWTDTSVQFFKDNNGDFCMEEVRNIKAPTFILHGKKDPMIAAEHIPYLRKEIKNCRYYEFGEGKHNIHLRYPDEFNRLVAEFLQQKP